MLSIPAHNSPCPACHGNCKYVQCPTCGQWSQSHEWEIYDDDPHFHTLVGICPRCERPVKGGYRVPDKRVLCANVVAEKEREQAAQKKGKRKTTRQQKTLIDLAQ